MTGWVVTLDLLGHRGGGEKGGGLGGGLGGKRLGGEDRGGGGGRRVGLQDLVSLRLTGEKFGGGRTKKMMMGVWVVRENEGGNVGGYGYYRKCVGGGGGGGAGGVQPCYIWHVQGGRYRGGSLQ